MSMNLEDLRSEASEQSLGLSHPDIYRKALHLIQARCPSPKSILDVGSGKGEFLRYIKPQFSAQLNGVDLMYGEGSHAEWLVQDLNHILKFGDKQFDVVTCLEVVEHIENPRQLIREIFRVLNPGGLLVLSTPNNHSWRSIISYIFREHFVAFTESSYPAHITAVNQQDLLRMFREAGFVDSQIHFSDHGSLPKMTSVTWQTASGGLLKGMRYSDNIFCSAIKKN